MDNATASTNSNDRPASLLKCEICAAEFIVAAGGYGDDDVEYCPFCGESLYDEGNDWCDE